MSALVGLVVVCPRLSVWVYTASVDIPDEGLKPDMTDMSDPPFLIHGRVGRMTPLAKFWLISLSTGNFFFRRSNTV